VTNASAESAPRFTKLDAETEAEIKRRLADDPWARTERLRITSVEPWTVFVGAERLHLARAAGAGA
jgi:hypothetical protein